MQIGRKNNIGQNFLLKNNLNQILNQIQIFQPNFTANQETTKQDINNNIKNIDFISLSEEDNNSKIDYRDLPNGVSSFKYKDAKYTIYRNNSEYKTEFYCPKNISETEFFNSYSSLKPLEASPSDTQSETIKNINGEIDENITQGLSGDCWILSALNSLSSTTLGKKVIQDSIKVNNDNTVTVTFNGLGVSYTMTADEIQKYDTDNKEDKYSNGDNDALVIEIATEKLLTDMNKGKVTISTKNENISEIEKSISEGGFPSRMLYYLTGIESKEYYNDTRNIDVNVIYDTLNEAYKKGNYSITFGLYDGIHEGELVNGGKYVINGGSGHALSVKNITENTVTFVNPWNNNEEYTMSYSEFANLGIGYLCVADLSEAQYQKTVTDMTGYVQDAKVTEENEESKTISKDNSKVTDTDNDYQYYDWEYDYDFNPSKYNNNESEGNNGISELYTLINKIMSFFTTLLGLFMRRFTGNDFLQGLGKNNQKL